jgi:hypothetical protein
LNSSEAEKLTVSSDIPWGALVQSFGGAE